MRLSGVAREFYLRLSLRERWGKRELERQIAGALFERSVLSPAKLSPAVTSLLPGSRANQSVVTSDRSRISATGRLRTANTYGDSVNPTVVTATYDYPPSPPPSDDDCLNPASGQDFSGSRVWRPPEKPRPTAMTSNAARGVSPLRENQYDPIRG
jgi:hypothetical protein